MLTPLIILFILFLLPDSLSVTAYPAVKKMGGFSFGDAISLTIITVLFIIAAVFISVIDKKHKK